jgi:hypothetical protein
MSGLYPSIIFHFTSKEGLFGILEENFKLSYALECVEGPSENTAFGVPMVSFCDLRLSELRQHMAHYNKYGIGLTKEWANRQGLNPVLYVSKNSDFTRGFMAAVKEIYPQPDTHKDVDELHRAQLIYMSVLNAYRFMKNYEGRLVRRNHKIIENYRFADEREWRYVRALDEFEPSFVLPSMISTSEQKKALNLAVADHRLMFQPEDIRYLIVESDSERLEVISHLRRVKHAFSKDEQTRLISRILTASQIENDI